MRISGVRNALGRLPGGRHRPPDKAQQAALAGEFRSDFSDILNAARRLDQPSRLICSSVTTRSTFSVLLLMR
jgi:hypothetical protein